MKHIYDLLWVTIISLIIWFIIMFIILYLTGDSIKSIDIKISVNFTLNLISIMVFIIAAFLGFKILDRLWGR